MSELLFERLARYRRLAHDAYEVAAATESPDARTAVCGLAMLWESLAAEVERAMQVAQPVEIVREMEERRE